MRGYLDRGYTVVKMKIGGASVDEDRARIEAVLAEIGAARLAVDANGRFDLETAIAYAKMLRDYPLFWYEEAGDPLDYALQAALAEFYPGPMATGENLFSHQDARNLLRYGGMRPDRDWLQFDCALSYGLCEYLRTLDVIRTAGWSPSRCIPHGGHQMSLNIAAGLGLGGNESYPDLFQPYGGFPDTVRVEDSHIVMPELPGIGFEGKSDLIAGDAGAGGLKVPVFSACPVALSIPAPRRTSMRRALLHSACCRPVFAARPGAGRRPGHQARAEQARAGSGGGARRRGGMPRLSRRQQSRGRPAGGPAAGWTWCCSARTG